MKHFKKSFSIIVFASASLMPVQAATHANQPGHFGIGGIIGEPTGVSGKYTIDSANALQAALGLSVVEQGVWLSADYLLQFPYLFTSDGNWPFYVGVGVVMLDRGNYARNNNVTGGAYLGVRALTGAEFLVRDRVSIFGEVSLSAFLAPITGLGLGIGVGARYWL